MYLRAAPTPSEVAARVDIKVRVLRMLSWVATWIAVGAFCMLLMLDR